MSSRSPRTRASNAIQTGAEIAPVQSDYTTLDVDTTKITYENLERTLTGLADAVISSIDQIVPQLAEMQALMSQRGKKRKKVLQQAGVPSWKKWATEYGKKFDRSFRTLQQRIREWRGGTARPQNSRIPTPRVPKLTPKQQTALVKAQVAANDLVRDVENAGNYAPAMAEYKRVAVSPLTLAGYLEAFDQEPDWKEVLRDLLTLLEPHQICLPEAIRKQLQSLKAKIGAPPLSSGTPLPAVPDKLVKAAQPASSPAWADTEKPPTKPVKSQRKPMHRVTKCPPACEMDGEGRSDRVLPDAAGYYPPAIKEAGFVRNEDGKWEYDPDDDR